MGADHCDRAEGRCVPGRGPFVCREEGVSPWVFMVGGVVVVRRGFWSEIRITGWMDGLVDSSKAGG